MQDQDVISFRLPRTEREALVALASREATAMSRVVRAGILWALREEPESLRRHLDGLPPDRRRRPKEPSPA